MAHSVNLRSDGGSAAGLRALWDRCAALENVPSMRSSTIRRTFTLAVCDAVDRSLTMPRSCVVPRHKQRLRDYLAQPA